MIWREFRIFSCKESGRYVASGKYLSGCSLFGGAGSECISVWGAYKPSQSDYVYFHNAFFLHHHNCLLCSAHLENSYWSKTSLPSCNQYPVQGKHREQNLEIPFFGICANPQVMFLSCRANKWRRPPKSESFPRMNVRFVLITCFESHTISALGEGAGF